MAERMNPEVKAKWLAALRSGEYKRGRGELHLWDDRMCPYGVLCDVAVHADVPVAVEQNLSGNWSYDKKTGTPPHRVLEWAGLADRVLLKYCGAYHTIPYLNDDVNLSFEAIADLIEVYL